MVQTEIFEKHEFGITCLPEKHTNMILLKYILFTNSFPSSHGEMMMWKHASIVKQLLLSNKI